MTDEQLPYDRMKELRREEQLPWSEALRRVLVQDLRQGYRAVRPPSWRRYLQSGIRAWWNRRNKKVIAIFIVVILVSVSLRVGWEYQARHNVQHQCTALHIIQNGGKHTATTHIAASSRIRLLEVDRALRQLYQEGFVDVAGMHGAFPRYQLAVDPARIRERCRGVQYQQLLQG